MKKNFWQRAKTDLKRNKSIYLIGIPVILFYILFHYKPMYGTMIAFFDYSPRRGLAGSDFIGLQNFIDYFESPFFFRTLKNTLMISFGDLLIGFPAPIILALLLNEVKNAKFKKTVQTITYLPHFISMVVICGMLLEFCLTTGLFNDIIEALGGTRTSLLQDTKYYLPIYVLSNVWQGVGWGSIIYLAALSGVDKQLYEAASIDGAGKWKQTLHITIPGIVPTIMIQLILKIGSIMSLGYEKTLLLYNPSIYSVSDIISSYTYRVGMVENKMGYAAAVGLFNSVVNCILLVFANKMSKKTTESGLW